MTHPPGAPVPAPFYTPESLRPDTSIGQLMKRGVQSIVSQIDRALAPHDLTHAQWLPLYRLAKGQGCTVAALAREQSQDPGAMTRALDRLEAKGLVRRERSATDRRVVQVALTDAGRSVAALVPPVLAQVLNQHLTGFTHDEWLQLVHLLQRVLANGDGPREAERLREAERTREAERDGDRDRAADRNREASHHREADPTREAPDAP